MSSDSTPRLLLLDGHSLAYRAFYALPEANFSTVTGQPTNAVYGFTSMLINLLRDEKPTHVAVAFDVSRTTFRTAHYPEYKATRSASPEGFRGQVELITSVLEAMRIPALTADNVEADDIIATLATKAVGHGMDVLIVTGDRDALQLVADGITVLYPRKGVSDLARMDTAAVVEKYGVTPQQYPDFAAVRGDASDNLPSIPGVGEKTAAKWIAEYGSLDALVAHVAEIGGKAGQSLRDHLPQVLLNHRLTHLLRDVPLPLGPADLVRRDVDMAAIHELFDTLQFRVLRERLAGVTGESGSEQEFHAADLTVVDVTRDGVGPILSALDRHQPVGVAISGVTNPGAGRAAAIALAQQGTAWLIDLAQLTSADRDSLTRWFSDAAAVKVMHDSKAAWHALAGVGIRLEGVVHDTALAAYLWLPGMRADLAEVVERVLGRRLSPTSLAQDQLSLDVGSVDRALGFEAAAVTELAEVLTRHLRERGMLTLLTDLEMPVTWLLADMEHTGIAVDAAHFERLLTDFAAVVAAQERRAHDLVGHAFNLGSPKQLQDILFTERGLPKTKRIKTGYTTDAEALTWLAENSSDPLPAVLLQWRDASKLRQTVEGLRGCVGPDGRIHTTFQQTVAATGRLSSTDPNLQNIPVRTSEGRRIREGFIVGEGFESLMTADYSQVELRIMAHVSEDEALIQAFRSGEDLHTTVAAQVFGVRPSDVDAEMRRQIKAMSYGLAYGLSAFGLAAQLGITSQAARDLMDEYFSRFGGIRDYLQNVVERARVVGYTETLLGRRRYLPDLTSDNRQRRDMAERMALNAPIQGTAADLMKVAMVRVGDALRADGMTSRLVLQVHDELVLEIAPGEQAKVTEIVRHHMGAAMDLRVPLDVSIGVGRSWHDAAH